MSTVAKARRVDFDAVFKAVGSIRRRDILRMLSEADREEGKTCCLDEEVCACKISERLGLSPSTTSHHMSILRDAGLVESRKDGLWTYYTLRRDVLAQAAEELKRF